jgi:hypothetical protein
MTTTKVILDREGMHATHMGGDLYRLDNIPFFSDTYAFGDIVRAVAPDSDSNPIVQELVTPSGNTTIRLVFGVLSRANVNALCKKLDVLGVGSEGLAYSPTMPHVRVFNVQPDQYEAFEKVIDLAEGLIDASDAEIASILALTSTPAPVSDGDKKRRNSKG